MLQNHMLAKHPKQAEAAEAEKSFRCPSGNCPYECRTKGQLRSHYLLKHMGSWVNKFFSKPSDSTLGCSCSSCGLQFQSKPAFLYHLPNCIPAEELANEEVERGLCI